MRTRRRLVSCGTIAILFGQLFGDVVWRGTVVELEWHVMVHVDRSDGNQSSWPGARTLPGPQRDQDGTN